MFHSSKLHLASFFRRSTSVISSITQVLDRRNAKEVLHAILHAILFHRLFGTVKPQTFEVLDVTVVRYLDSRSLSCFLSQHLVFAFLLCSLFL